MSRAELHKGISPQRVNSVDSSTFLKVNRQRAVTWGAVTGKITQTGQPVEGSGFVEKARGIYRITSERGFTLVEVFIALAILAILVAVTLPAYHDLMERNQIRTAGSDIVLISADLERYYADQSAYPPDLETIGAALVDPWGNEYQYLNMAVAKGTGKKRKDRNLVPLNTDFDLYSKGPDGLSASPLTAGKSQDDIIRANNGKFIGLASEY